MSQEPTLFEMPPDWAQHWAGMPAFQQENKKPHSTINVQFECQEDREAFLLMLGEHPQRQKSIWFPQKSYLIQSEKQEGALDMPQGKFPIYIISKGRAGKPLTSKALSALSIKHSVVVEPQEEATYRAALPGTPLHILPFSNLGLGSIPARNWVWDHAEKSGHSAHWILDDNMDGFYELNNNLKKRIRTYNPFSMIEDFFTQYHNIALTGMNYEFFADRRSIHPPFILNTRIYSCILINHSLPFRWRGRYNEDTDLSLRALKAGWCTVLFNAYLCKKMPTMTMGGGNSDELYQGDGRLKMAQSLLEQHPDVVSITHKWGRPQHQVNYTPFKKNTLKRYEESRNPIDISPYCPEWCSCTNPCNTCRAANEEPSLFA